MIGSIFPLVRGHPLRSLRSASPSLREGEGTSLTTDSWLDHVRLPLPCPSGWAFRPLKRRLSPE